MDFKDIISKPKLIRYGFIFIGILVLLKSIPNKSLENRDTFVVSIVLFSLYIIVENVFTKASICGPNKEQFGEISPIVPDQISSTLPSYVQKPQIQSEGQQQLVLQPQLVSQPQTVQVQPQQQIPDALKPGECKDCVKKSTDQYGMDTYIYKTNTNKYETSAPTRAQAGVMQSEVQYTDYNIMPVTPEDSKLYEYGYSFLPPEKWYPIPPHPPVCVTEKSCPVCPMTTTGSPVDMKEWNDSRRITPGDVINIDYARDKLNSGR